jgi:hypothetical protein
MARQMDYHAALIGGTVAQTRSACCDSHATDLSWTEWQRCVLDTIQTDFRGVLDRIGWDDIDWDAWRPLFEQGASAREAVRSAFGKVA